MEQILDYMDLTWGLHFGHAFRSANPRANLLALTGAARAVNARLKMPLGLQVPSKKVFRVGLEGPGTWSPRVLVFGSSSSGHGRFHPRKRRPCRHLPASSGAAE